MLTVCSDAQECQKGSCRRAEEVQLLRTLILSVVDDPGAPQGIQQALLTKPSRLAQKP